MVMPLEYEYKLSIADAFLPADQQSRCTGTKGIEQHDLPEKKA